ncbi:elongation factor 3 [Thraustotheca clavata]|uniref:Elongation factor 3 n=1 Tax=Thraustotheca clavata TaxID=74557 RepID=A0A1V9ZQJ5_9STRA|nr:elongation factor 3 [Thraustotheca clavata]
MMQEATEMEHEEKRQESKRRRWREYNRGKQQLYVHQKKSELEHLRAVVQSLENKLQHQQEKAQRLSWKDIAMALQDDLQLTISNNQMLRQQRAAYDEFIKFLVKYINLRPYDLPIEPPIFALRKIPLVAPPECRQLGFDWLTQLVYQNTEMILQRYPFTDERDEFIVDHSNVDCMQYIWRSQRDIYVPFDIAIKVAQEHVVDKISFTNLTDEEQQLSDVHIEPLDSNMLQGTSITYSCVTFWNEPASIGSKLLFRRYYSYDRFIAVGQTISQDETIPSKRPMYRKSIYWLIVDNINPTHCHVRSLLLTSQSFLLNGHCVSLHDEALTWGCDLSHLPEVDLLDAACIIGVILELMGKGQKERLAAKAAANASMFGRPSAGINVAAPAFNPTAKSFVSTARVPAPPPVAEYSRILATDEQCSKFQAIEDATERKQTIDKMLHAMTGPVERTDRQAAIADVVKGLELLGTGNQDGHYIIEFTRNALTQKSVHHREGALLALTAMGRCDAISSAIEPVVVELLVTIIERHGDKEPNVRDASIRLTHALLDLVNPLATRTFLSQIFACLDIRQWQCKVAALDLLRNFSPRASAEISSALPEIIPKVSEIVWDTKPQVQQGALAALTAACSTITNDDVLPLVPTLVSVIAHPEQSLKAIDALLATTFVANVDAATLSLIAPLLNKALRDQSTNSSALRRKASRIIDSMCRLVSRPSDVAPFVPLLLPQLDIVIERIADQEVAEVAADARACLKRAAGEGSDDEDPAEVRQQLQQNLLKGLYEALDTKTHPGLTEFTLTYITDVCAELVSTNRGKEWRGLVLPYLSAHLHDEDADRVCKALRKAGGGLGEDRVASTDPNDVCDIDFSLAYGGKILLRNARLRLTRGHRYGLIGKNGVGKTTLMRNISNHTIEGLPTHLRTVYVQHEDVVEDKGSLLESLMAAPELAHNAPEIFEKTLVDIGFTRTMLDGPISALSGGWRMKLSLVRAMLYNADVLLLDEPTNHLDVHAVQWLVDYLNSLESMTVLLVSHDTGFLDNVCTDVLHYESKKLVLYPGSLSKFVEKHPEAKHYYELASTDTQFILPQPGRLEGISSTTRRILSIEHCDYTYPGASKPQLVDVSVKLCLASRVAVIGANGAGKSTLIKMIVQDTQPDNGDFWKHHNLRVAYVAQHSLHHVEQHLDSSPVQYIQWRFGGPGGIDRELAERVDKNESEAAKAEGAKGSVEKIMSRRKGKRGTLEYECKLWGMTESKNRYFTLEELQAMGLGKMAEMEDIRQATLASGTDLRPTTTKEVQKHLDDFNLNAEFGTHGKIRGLSGGQKVKLVIAAAMWTRPHLLVLDEPTNYLDRAALGALADGIRGFAGGCIMISHSEEFYNSLCTEKWLVESGRVRVIGEAQETEYRLGGGKKVIEEEEDPNRSAFGSTNDRVKVTGVIINPKSLRAMSTKDIRKMQKCAKAAGRTIEEHVAQLTRDSPEWKWLPY